jgi:hypothetical protein
LAVCRNKRQHCQKQLAQIGLDMQLISAALLSHGEDVEMEDEDNDDMGLEGSMDLEGKTVPQLKECLASCVSALNPRAS